MRGSDLPEELRAALAATGVAAADRLDDNHGQPAEAALWKEGVAVGYAETASRDSTRFKIV